jgi:hypothetical protein
MEDITYIVDTHTGGLRGPCAQLIDTGTTILLNIARHSKMKDVGLQFK